jgi:hypothetical protein
MEWCHLWRNSVNSVRKGKIVVARHGIATLFAALAIINAPIFAKRVDPRNEAPALRIAGLLRSTRLVAVFCGDDADMQTCKFFAKALQYDLRKRNIGITLRYQPEVMVQSFYVPPMAIPFTGVTLRLIEDSTGADGAVQVYVSGFCFSDKPNSQNGYRLPIWVETESARDTGPLESDKAKAASRLALEFSAFWDKPTDPQHHGSPATASSRRWFSINALFHHYRAKAKFDKTSIVRY